MSWQTDQIIRVMEQAFDPRWGETWTAQQVMDSLSNKGNFAILIDADASILDAVGQAAAGFLLGRCVAGEEELLLIGVTPQFRHRGLGQKLIETHMESAKKRGSRRIFLEMRANNPAMTLYRKNGFKPIGQRRNYYKMSDGNTLDAITFGRIL